MSDFATPWTAARQAVSMCRVISCVIEKGYLLRPVHCLGKILLAFAPLHFVLQCQSCLLLQVSLDFLLLHSNTLWWKGHLFFMLVLEGLAGPHKIIQLQLIWHQWLGHRSGLLWCWMVCLGYELRSFFLFWDCTHVLDCEGYSISSKGFFSTIVDIMVIWIKFTHSCPF